MQFPEAALHDKITVNEALTLFASFYDTPADVHELLTLLGLQDKRDARHDPIAARQPPRLPHARLRPARPRRGKGLDPWQRPVLGAAAPDRAPPRSAGDCAGAARDRLGDTWAGTPFYGVSVINVILPAMLAMPIAITALPTTFGGFREKGILRRFSATPMRPQSMFAVHFIINVPGDESRLVRWRQFPWIQMGSMIAWTVVLTPLAVKLFKWR